MKRSLSKKIFFKFILLSGFMLHVLDAFFLPLLHLLAGREACQHTWRKIQPCPCMCTMFTMFQHNVSRLIFPYVTLIWTLHVWFVDFIVLKHKEASDCYLAFDLFRLYVLQSYVYIL